MSTITVPTTVATSVTTIATTTKTTTKATTARPTPLPTPAKTYPPTPKENDCGLISIDKQLNYPNCDRDIETLALTSQQFPEYLQYQIIVKRQGKQRYTIVL
jgi:hypothetical protein